MAACPARLTPPPQRKTLDIVTVFHKAGCPASTRVANLLKQISANTQAGATLDQASDYTSQIKAMRDPFELSVTEEPPTAEQVQTILEYVGKGNIPRVIKGARDQKEALKKFKESKDSFLRPVVSHCGARKRLLLLTGPRRWTGTRARPLPVTTSLRFSSWSTRKSDCLGGCLRPRLLQDALVAALCRKAICTCLLSYLVRGHTSENVAGPFFFQFTVVYCALAPLHCRVLVL